MKVLNQKYHVVFSKGEVTVRRPWKGKDVELFSPDGDPDYGISAMFGDHEERPFLETLGPFIVISIDTNTPKGIEQSIVILDEGYVVEDPDTHEKSKWKVCGYYMRDDGVTYILVPFDKEIPNEMDLNGMFKPQGDAIDLWFLKSLGLTMNMNNDWGNTFKVGKYLKRLYSPHRHYIQGEVISKGSGNVILVRLPDGKVLSVRYADYGVLTDGMSLISTHCMERLGLKREIGQGLRITALSPNGFSKGHAIVLPHLHHDLVLFNSKQLLFGEQFTLGVDWLHAGKLFTDVQSVTNFRMYRTSFLARWFAKFGQEVILALRDEEKLRQMLNFHNKKFHQYDRGEDEGEFIEKEKEWSLIRAMRAGINHKTHPALVRKYFRLFMDKVADCERLRVPVPPEDGGARYAIVDPTIFDANGDPTRDGVLKGNQVYCPNHIGDLVFHRQPNAHRGEHHIATSIPSRILRDMDAGHFMFLSRDMIAESLKKLGGGDQDDRLVYYTNPEIVDHFKQLEADPYPVVDYIPAPFKESRINTFAHLKMRHPVYDRHQFLLMIGQQKEQGVNIGYAVNAIINDTILTDDKSNILDFMIRELPKNRKNNSAIQWLEKKPDYQLRNVTSRLEVVIDAVTKTGSDLKEIGAELKQYNATFEVVPRFCTTGGKFEGRVPTSRRNETYPVIVLCDVDRVQDTLRQIRRDLEDQVTDDSWQMLQPVPMEVLTCPRLEGSQHLAAAIRADYVQQRQNLEKEAAAGTEKEIIKKNIENYIKIDVALYNRYKDNPKIVDAMLYLYASIYDKRQPEAPRYPDGRTKPFPDGILWGPRMSGFTILALTRAGLAGRFVKVNLDPEFKQFRDVTMPVEIYKNLVMNPATGEVIGSIDETVDNVTTVMTKGFVKVFPPAPKATMKRVMSLTVVNGMEARGASPAELQEWLSHSKAQKKVELVPYIYVNENGDEEHAVRVMLEGKEYGHISRKDAGYILEKTFGYLCSGRSMKTATVEVEV